MNQRSRSFFVGLLTALSLAGCGSGGAPDARGVQAHLPGALLLPSAPAGARPVREVVASAHPGDEVVVAGRVGQEGSDHAYFTLVDASVKACSESALKDPCPTPWDFCCSPPDELARVSALVEFRDGGALYPGNVIGFGGLDHLKDVVVQGKAEKDSAGNLTIVASGISVRE